MLLAVPEGHSLAQAQGFTPEGLAAQQWIAVLHREGGLQHDSFIAACEKAGFTPDISLAASEPLAAWGLVAVGLGMRLIQQSLQHQVSASK